MVCIFSDQKWQFGYIFEGVAMEDVGIFSCTFGLFYGQFYGSEELKMEMHKKQKLSHSRSERTKTAII
jgi:hypothetical protein